jgi:hypothetical protein
MATWTTTPSLASNRPAMLPADRTLEPACGWFVLGTWLFLTVVALGFVTLYGNRTPRWEDWIFVPFVTGAQRVDLSWLWEDIQGHRMPIEKLVLCACYSLFGFNSKPILYLNVLLFSVLSLGLLGAIRKARGRWSYTDAFLPIVLLNLGQIRPGQAGVHHRLAVSILADRSRWYDAGGESPIAKRHQAGATALQLPLRVHDGGRG